MNPDGNLADLDLEDAARTSALDEIDDFLGRLGPELWHKVEGNFQKILEDITIEKPYGEKITIDAGTTVEGFFDLDIYELIYCYSFQCRPGVCAMGAYGSRVGIRHVGHSWVRRTRIGPVSTSGAVPRSNTPAFNCICVASFE